MPISGDVSCVGFKILMRAQPQYRQTPNDSVLCHSLAKMPNVIFSLTLHGGHLGFFEGAVLFPQPLTWMDKVIVEYANVMCQWEKQKPPCQSAHMSESSCAEGKV